MLLDKKTTILFSAEMHDQLVRVAKREGVSLGELVRAACRDKYRLLTREERLALVDELGRMASPVGSPEELKKEYVPRPKDLPE